MTRRIVPLLLVLAAIIPLVFAAPAARADNPRPAGILSDKEIASLKGMTDAQRTDFLREKAKALSKMSSADRQRFFAQNRKAFNALPPEKQKEIRAKVKAESDDYNARHKAEWQKSVEENKKISEEKQKEFLKSMPGVERAVLAKYKTLRKTHSRDYAWRMILEDAYKGGIITPVPAK